MKTDVWLACLAAIVLSGCGYTAKSRLRDDITCIAIPIFRNQTFYRDIELDLAQALREEVLAKTRLRITSLNDPRTDAYIEGEITDFNLTRLKEDIEGRVVEYQVRLEADITLKDRRNGQVIFRKAKLSRRAEFQVSRDQQLGQAREEAVRELAREIVSQVLNRW